MGIGTSGDVVAVWALATVTSLLLVDQLDRGSLSGWPFHSEGQALGIGSMEVVLSCPLNIFSICVCMYLFLPYNRRNTCLLVKELEIEKYKTAEKPTDRQALLTLHTFAYFMVEINH